MAAEAYVKPSAWLSHVVLAEAVWVLDAVYGVKSAQMAAGIETLLDHESLVLENAEVMAAALAQVRRHPSVGFSDCLVVEIARGAGHGPLGTFDRRLARLDGAVRVAN